MITKVIHLRRDTRVHTLLSTLTTLILAVHVGAGCCFHHAHECGAEEPQAAEHATHCCHDHHDHGGDDSSSHSEHDSHEHSCDGTRCVFVKAGGAPQIDLSLKALWYVVAPSEPAEPVSTSVAVAHADHVFRPGAGSTRLYLLHGLLLI